MGSEAKTVKEYLDSLPEDRCKALMAVRTVIRKHLPKGYKEALNWGMISYEVPLRIYPDTYNGQPLMYAALASQKNHMAVYLSGCYVDAKVRRQFEDAYKAAGKRLDAGKSCVRFRKLEDLPLEVIGDAIAQYSVEEFVAITKQAHGKKRSRTKR
jgi:hypothetical protein